MPPWLLLALLVTTPNDPFEGTVFTARERDILPSGQHLGSLADTWLVETTSMQAGHNGIALFDRLYVSSHGRSWTQQRYLLNGIEITDPAQPGQPLIELPHGAWDQLRFRSLWTARPGFEWRVEIPSPGARPRLDAAGGWATDVGGGTWVPAGLMDREPALRTGASPTRRALSGGSGGELDLHLPNLGIPTRIFFERLEHTHLYPTLTHDDGGQLLDDAERTTLLGGTRWWLGGVPLELLAVYQGIGRTHEGAQARHPELLTHTRHSDALVVGLGTELRLTGGVQVDLRAGLGWRDETWTPNGQDPQVVDLVEQWTWLERPRFGEQLERRRLDLSATVTRGALRLSLSGFAADLTSRADIPGQRSATTYLGASEPTARAVSVTHFGTPQVAEEWLAGSRLALEAEPHLWGLDWRLYAAIDQSAVGTPGATGLMFVDPAVGVAMIKDWADHRFFLLLRREPELLTAQVSSFLDPRRPSGTEHAWLDDGDLVPEAGETGSLIRRLGGDAHGLRSDLRRPTSNHLALGWRSPRFGPFRFSVTGISRLLLDRFMVRLAGARYQPLTITDPGGDGLGEQLGADGEAQRLIVYGREPGDEGEERYLLSNADAPDWFVGAELQLATVGTRWWFMSLGLSGYWDVGGAPFGLYADRNDPGVIDPASADPNAQVNARGRYDHDRAFGANLLVGLAPQGVLEGLTGGVVIRYRDGEPMTRILVVEDLPQGPTAVMAVPRGDPMPRFTFALTLDVKVSYTFAIDPFVVMAQCEVLNLLGSGTELAENIATGESFRRSLEMVPGRTVRIGLGVGWR